jgi:hypothetical protein
LRVWEGVELARFLQPLVLQGLPIHKAQRIRRTRSSIR